MAGVQGELGVRWLAAALHRAILAKRSLLRSNLRSAVDGQYPTACSTQLLVRAAVRGHDSCVSGPLAPLGERGPGVGPGVRGADSTPRGVSLLLHLLIRRRLARASIHQKSGSKLPQSKGQRPPSLTHWSIIRCGACPAVNAFR